MSIENQIVQEVAVSDQEATDAQVVVDQVTVVEDNTLTQTETVNTDNENVQIEEKLSDDPVVN